MLNADKLHLKKEYFREFIFLTLIPFGIAIGIGIATAVVSPMGVGIGEGAVIAVYLVIALFVKIKKGYSGRAFVRAIIYTTIILIILNINFRIKQADKEYFTSHIGSDKQLMKEAIYTNDQTICSNLKTNYKEVCELSFERSFELCNKKLEDSPRSACIKNVLYLTDDLATCRGSYAQHVCNESYTNKWAVYALIKKDKSLCEKIIYPEYGQECIRNVSLLLSSPEQPIGDFDDGHRWLFEDLQYRYDLFQEGQLYIN